MFCFFSSISQETTGEKPKIKNATMLISGLTSENWIGCVSVYLLLSPKRKKRRMSWRKEMMTDHIDIPQSCPTCSPSFSQEDFFF